MPKDYGGYFYTTKSGIKVFVPTTKQESIELAKELDKNAKASKTGRLSAENLKIANNAKERFKDIIVEIKPPKWYYHICEELDNNLTPEEKGSPLVCRPILDYTYVAINFGHYNYVFIGVLPNVSLDEDRKRELDKIWPK